jgi:hypothetical protein
MQQNHHQQDTSTFERDDVAQSQLGHYVWTGMFPVFNFPFAEKYFKIGGKLYQHYAKVCSLLVGHMLTSAEKNDYYMKKSLRGRI